MSNDISEGKTLYHPQGSVVTLSKAANRPDPLKSLPVDYYVVQFHPMLGFHLEVVDEFQLPEKLYGDAIDFAAKVINTFQNRDTNTGVMMIGEKGSGKSMTARAICKLGISQKIPVLLINSPFSGDGFNSFLSSIDQPVIVFIDEFEKVYYKSEDQQSLLTILDGVYQSRKLFLMTCNQSHRLDPNLSNRPGRLHYWKEYTGLNSQEIREFAEDNLKEKSLLGQVISACSVFQGQLNFDMLRALVQETNMYPKEPVMDHLKILNIQPSYVTPRPYKYKLFIGNREVSPTGYSPGRGRMNPLNVGRRDTDVSNGVTIYVEHAALIAAINGVEYKGSRNPDSDRTQTARGMRIGASISVKKGINVGSQASELGKLNLTDRDALNKLLQGGTPSSSLVNKARESAEKRMMNSTYDDGSDEAASRDFLDLEDLQTQLDQEADSDGDLSLNFSKIDQANSEIEKGKFAFKHESLPITLVMVREEEDDSRSIFSAYGDRGY